MYGLSILSFHAAMASDLHIRMRELLEALERASLVLQIDERLGQHLAQRDRRFFYKSSYSTLICTCSLPEPERDSGELGKDVPYGAHGVRTKSSDRLISRFLASVGGLVFAPKLVGSRDFVCVLSDALLEVVIRHDHAPV